MSSSISNLGLLASVFWKVASYPLIGLELPICRFSRGELLIVRLKELVSYSLEKPH
jgi:hypothetical protein